MIGLGKEEAKKRVYDLSEEFFLVGMLEIPMKHLSKGSLQKVGVVQSLLVESPAITFNKVVFPQPLCPVNATEQPCSIVRLISFKTILIWQLVIII